MNTLEIYVKNMVCNRCIRVVREELQKVKLNVLDVKLGEVKIGFSKKKPDIKLIKKVLIENGFDLLEDKKAKLVEKIKTVIIELIYTDKLEELNINFSKYIEDNIGKDYHYLSSLFSSVESITIEKFFILQKIERVKELLVYDELTLSEIAYRMGYSSVHHLSNQFKKVTGLTPSYFKTIKKDKRKPIDHIH
jgi:AraC-like DNA-binding protein